MKARLLITPAMSPTAAGLRQQLNNSPRPRRHPNRKTRRWPAPPCMLPTVNGGRTTGTLRLAAPGLSTPMIPAFFDNWDQGEVDVGNGRSDSAWVHDDLKITALACHWPTSR